MHRYFAEFDFRYNRRGVTDSERSTQRLKGIVASASPIGGLISSPPNYFKPPVWDWRAPQTLNSLTARRVGSRREETMQIKTAMVGNSEGGQLFKCDVIEHQGLLWLVPEWLQNRAEGWMMQRV